MDLQEGEVAVPIDGFPGYYITSRGRVWSTKRNKWLKSRNQHRYYYVVELQKEGKSYCRQIHRLVGIHFLPIINIKGALICHKNEELPYPEINFVENLWIGTQQQNLIGCVEKGRGTKGKKMPPHTEEHKRRISESKKGSNHSLETRQKISKTLKGKKHSPEHKRNLSKAHKKRRNRESQK